MKLDEAIEVLGGARVVPAEATDNMCEAAWESDAADYVGEHKRICNMWVAWQEAIAAAPPQYDEALSAVIEAARMLEWMVSHYGTVENDGPEHYWVNWRGTEDRQQQTAYFGDWKDAVCAAMAKGGV